MAEASLTISFPGEKAIEAISGVLKAAIEGQTVEQRKIMWDRYIEVTEPWHGLAVQASKDIVAFLASIKKALE